MIGPKHLTSVCKTLRPCIARMKHHNCYTVQVYLFNVEPRTKNKKFFKDKKKKIN